MELCISKEIVYLHWNIVCYVSIQICYFELDIILEFKYYMSHNLFSSKFLSFTIYSKTENTMAQLLP